jgi:shikimate dehydrogenase
MRKYIYLIGYPLRHSVSPTFQQAALDCCHLNVQYHAWETEPAKLETAVEQLRRSTVLGANVTVPYKEKVIPLLDELDELAEHIGAVNTIANRDARLIGYNTDATGFLKALRQQGKFEPMGKSVVILGAGGVARAVSFILIKAGVCSLAITDIIPERAETLASNLEPSNSEVFALSRQDENFFEVLSNCELLVNCTPVGMKHSSTEGHSPLEEEVIPRGALIYDVVYNPVQTPLLASAAKLGLPTLGGLAMLVYQGAASFEIWTGQKPPIDIMFAAADEALE